MPRQSHRLPTDRCQWNCAAHTLDLPPAELRRRKLLKELASTARAQSTWQSEACRQFLPFSAGSYAKKASCIGRRASNPGAAATAAKNPGAGALDFFNPVDVSRHRFGHECTSPELNCINTIRGQPACIGCLLA